ncbi:hypothetical protein SLEP1_g54850 [Rubroshorea leprosula]|uniref:Uncharacterized protein n=1 Tax=Rubroshorea leprosula TaxID=152421 RepID=A0AAV5MHF0_9ROSI|nr:hypothetical protein SLEP1_g54850 [Rubroshorea leprosula]
MAYRGRQGMTRASTFKDEINNHVDDSNDKSSDSHFTSSHSFPSSSLHPLSTRSPSDSLAAQAIRASAARRESPVFGGDTSPRFVGGDRDTSPGSKGGYPTHHGKGGNALQALRPFEPRGQVQSR